MSNEKTNEFGVTWATPDHSIAQTGYDFETVALATVAAVNGPAAYAGQVDPMCSHDHAVFAELYGMVQTTETNEIEVRVRGNPYKFKSMWPLGGEGPMPRSVEVRGNQ